MSPLCKQQCKRRNPTALSILCLVLLFANCFCGNYAPLALNEASAAEPEQIILTWTEDPATSQTVTWLMSENIMARIQYLQKAGFEGSFDSAAMIEVQGTAFDNARYLYKADISALIPDTAYVYRVGREGSWSRPLSFKTAADTENFAFLYLGDVQAGYVEWGNMLDSIYQSYPQIKFSLLGGDLTDNSNDTNEWGQFLDAAARIFSRIPVMPTRGNHDGEMYCRFFALPSNGPAGLPKEFYSFDYGNAHFVVLNSNNNTNAAAQQWLQQDLQNTTKKWKFAVFHHPAYPVFRDYKGIDQSIRENWIPILEQNHVDMVFVGHQHEYMRTHPIYQGEVQTDWAAYGIVYVMGNSGAKTYAGGDNFPYTATVQTGASYQVINIDGDILTMTAQKADGELIENYTLNKSPAYLTIPAADSAYTIGTNNDGISTMIVNNGVSGVKTFTVDIQPKHVHNGTETVVFSCFRNHVQVGLTTLVDDFDKNNTAKALFNVQAGDVVKVFVIDDLSYALNHNPLVMQ